MLDHQPTTACASSTRRHAQRLHQPPRSRRNPPISAMPDHSATHQQQGSTGPREFPSHMRARSCSMSVPHRGCRLPHPAPARRDLFRPLIQGGWIEKRQTCWSPGPAVSARPGSPAPSARKRAGTARACSIIACRACSPISNSPMATDASRIYAVNSSAPIY